MNKMNKAEVIGALCALAHESRLDIFRYLIQRGFTGAAAGQIAGKLRLPSATLSFHLSVLKQAGLVEARRASRSIIYSASFDSMNALMAYLLANCCRGMPEAGTELVSLNTAKGRANRLGRA